MNPHINPNFLSGFKQFFAFFHKRMLMGNYVAPFTDLFPIQKNRYALINCKMFNGIQPKLSENMTVLVDGEFIRDVGNKEKIIIPDDFIVYDLEGQTLMPGMLDSHSHVFSPFIYDIKFISYPAIASAN